MPRPSSSRPLRTSGPSSPHPGNPALWGLFAIGAAAALWSVAAVTARHLFDRGVEPLELAEARSFIAAACLVLIPAARKGKGGGSLVPVIALGLSIALVNAVYYSAIARLDVAVALVLQYTAPALVVGWVALQRRKPPNPEIAAALVVTFAGVVLVSGLLGGDIGNLDMAGVGFGLAASVLFATYTLLSEKAGATYGVLGSLLRGFCAAAVMWTVFQIPRGWPTELFEARNLPGVIFVGIAGTFAPFILFLWGVQKVQAERAAIAATSEPILAAVIAWIWLGQSLTVMQIAGGVLILGGVVALQVRLKEVLVPEL